MKSLVRMIRRSLASRPPRPALPWHARVLARIVAEHFSLSLGQRFIVDNRPGAGTSIGAEIVAKAMPDGTP